MKIFYSCNYLMEKLASFLFFHSLVFDNIIKELTPTSVFHDQVQLFRCFYNLKNKELMFFYFIELYDIWMSYQFQYMNFSRYSFYIIYILDFIFLQYFNSNLLNYIRFKAVDQKICYFFSSQIMTAKFNFPKCSLSYCFTQKIFY